MAELIKKRVDPINPSYYKGTLVADVIEEFGLNFNLGSVLKYVLRAGKKPLENPKTELEKAAWYLKREIERISK